MKKTILLGALLMLSSLAGTFAQEHNHRNIKILETRDQMEETIADPAQFDTRYSHNKLRLYPIIASETFLDGHKDIGRFTLLKEAISTQKITISETGAASQNNLNNVNVQSNMSGEVSGTVNTLFAKNNSQDTIFIMAGEVVKGGKQDRVIGQDIVLAPGEEKDLSAFCVEKSRWSTKEGNGGKFTDYYQVSSMDIRKVVTKDKDQHEVWKKVDEHTEKNKATSDTKAYTNLENSKEYQQKVKAYIDAFGDAFKDDERVIGVIAVTGDKVIGVDMFATHDLFIRSYPNLLHSYVGHAITNGEEVTITNNDVYAYLDEILRDQEKQNEVIEENGAVYEYRNKKLHISKF